MRQLPIFALLAAAHAIAQSPISLPDTFTPKPGTLVTNRIAVAFMGDSYAAGEGAPNTSGALWDSEPCHNSTKNGRDAVGGILREALDSRISVANGQIRTIYEFDYVDVACSGATIKKGMLGPYAGVTPMRPSGPGPARTPLPTQIKQVKDWATSIGRTKVDVVVMSIGGNDVGFADVVVSCINPLVAQCHMDVPLLAKMEFGDPGKAEFIGFSALPDALRDLNTKIREELNPSRIVLVSYPNPMRNKFGKLCDRFDEHFSIVPGLGDSFHPRNDGLMAGVNQLNSFEAAWIETSLIKRVNDLRQNLSGELGWDFISIEDFTKTHGFCNSDSVAWFNTPKRSWNTQDDFNGTAHPNRTGYRVYEHFLLRKLARDLDIHVSRTPSGFLEEHGFYLIKKNNNPPGTSNPDPTIQLANKPEIFVNADTFDEVLDSDQALAQYEKDFNMQFQFLLNPTPNQITEIKVEVSTTSFSLNPSETAIRRYSPNNPLAQSGMLSARVPTHDYLDNSLIYVRWRIKSRPYWDASAAPTVTYSPVTKFRIKGAQGPMVKVVD